MYNYKYDEFLEEKVPRALKDEMGDGQGIRKESDRTPRSERGEAASRSSGREGEECSRHGGLPAP